MRRIVPVHRHRDPLRVNVKRANIPDRLKIASQTKLNKFTSTKQVRDYIEEYLLFGSDIEHEDALEHFQSVANQQLSPLHVSMFLMGCYGYADNDRHTSNITRWLTHDVLWTDWSTSFLLEALEHRFATSSSLSGATRDHSACTCMKDFASMCFYIACRSKLLVCFFYLITGSIFKRAVLKTTCCMQSPGQKQQRCSNP